MYESDKLRSMALKLDLGISGGSDFHGVIDYSHGDLAYNVLEGKDVDNFLKKLGDKREG